MAPLMAPPKGPHVIEQFSQRNEQSYMALCLQQGVIEVGS